MRQHRFRPGSFPSRVDRHGKRAPGKIQQLRYVSDVDAQAAKWGLENHAPDVGRSAEPETVTVIALDRFSASSRGPKGLVGCCEDGRQRTCLHCGNLRKCKAFGLWCQPEHSSLRRGIGGDL